MRDSSAEILVQPFPWEAIVSSFGLGSCPSSISSADQGVACPPRRPPLGMDLERLSWHVTFPNHASFHLLTAASRSSGGGGGEAQGADPAWHPILVLFGRSEMGFSFVCSVAGICFTVESMKTYFSFGSTTISHSTTQHWYIVCAEQTSGVRIALHSVSCMKVYCNGGTTTVGLSTT